MKKLLSCLFKSRNDSEDEESNENSIHDYAKNYRTLTRNVKNQLLPLNHKAISKFSFNGITRFAKVTKIIDGDTFWCAIPYPMAKRRRKQKFVRICVRMDGIDTAEKTSDIEEEVELAQKAKDRLTELIGPDQIVYIEFGKEGKYGRNLAVVFHIPEGRTRPYDIPINEILVAEKLAMPYEGGKKMLLTEYLKTT